MARPRAISLRTNSGVMKAGTEDPLPPSFAIYPTWVAHGYLAALLAGLITVHVLAALYHLIIRKDGLFRRMSFGRSPR